MSNIVEEDEPPMTTNRALRRQLSRLRDAFIHGLPFCQGVVCTSADDLELFYGKGTDVSRINFSNASAEDLQKLAETCDPATFGVKQQDVYDETYRRAGKLDKRDFAINLSLDALGILDTIRTELLIEGGSGPKLMRAELYKLNVYGTQSFFKAHVDTPRSEQMFGSLVIVLPTPHEGGAFVLRDNGGTTDSGQLSGHTDPRREWMFDSATLLAQNEGPSVAYVAFFSDVEHEVMPVLSGYRVTITYNLFYVRDPSPATGPTRLVAAEEERSERGDSSVVVPPVLSASEQILRSTLQSLLDDPTFLPEGGNLLFGLHYRYPLPTYRERILLKTTRQQQLQDVALRLKAGDAMLLRTVHSFELDAKIRMIFQGKWNDYADELSEDGDKGKDVPPGMPYTICDLDPCFDEGGVIETFIQYALEEPNFGGVRLDPDAKDPAFQVHWIGSKPWGSNAETTTYVTYGNEPCMGYAYWKLGLLVPVGPAGKRQTRS
ncbi:hypothetical protein C8Q70DRAFT_1017236 [Cubamyces menziesii]|nr:hypothetical protein C8Q70DRAFT_1017236 [Cubamyces menziesii]